jgi:hypothetical protein
VRGLHVAGNRIRNIGTVILSVRDTLRTQSISGVEGPLQFPEGQRSWALAFESAEYRQVLSYRLQLTTVKIRSFVHKGLNDFTLKTSRKAFHLTQ